MNKFYVEHSMAIQEGSIKRWLDPWASSVPAYTSRIYEEGFEVVRPRTGTPEKLKLYKAQSRDLTQIGPNPYKQWQEFDSVIGSLAFKVAHDLPFEDVWLESFPPKLSKDVGGDGWGRKSALMYTGRNGVWMGMVIETQLYDYRYTLYLLLAVWKGE